MRKLSLIHQLKNPVQGRGDTTWSLPISGFTVVWGQFWSSRDRLGSFRVEHLQGFIHVLVTYSRWLSHKSTPNPSPMPAAWNWPRPLCLGKGCWVFWNFPCTIASVPFRPVYVVLKLIFVHYFLMCTRNCASNGSHSLVRFYGRCIGILSTAIPFHMGIVPFPFHVIQVRLSRVIPTHSSGHMTKNDQLQVHLRRFL